PSSFSSYTPYLLFPHSFFFHCSAAHRDLHSFPTRRSSDLGTCSNPAKPNGATCDDGSACTRTDTCQAGTCIGTNPVVCAGDAVGDRKSTRLNSSHVSISYAVFCLKKKKKKKKKNQA